MRRNLGSLGAPRMLAASLSSVESAGGGARRSSSGSDAAAAGAGAGGGGGGGAGGGGGGGGGAGAPRGGGAGGGAMPLDRKVFAGCSFAIEHFGATVPYLHRHPNLHLDP